MTALHLLPDDAVVRSDGTSARLEDDRIVVRSADGTPILSVGDEGLTIVAAHGDLRLVAPEGKVVIQGGTDVELHAEGTLTARSQRARVESREVSAAAELVTASLGHVRQRVGTWELTAERVVERATHTYRRVEALAELHAGRVRELVRGAHQLVAHRASVRCEDDVTVDGREIRLG